MKIIAAVTVAAPGAWKVSTQRDGYIEAVPTILTDFDLSCMARCANITPVSVTVEHGGEIVGRTRRVYLDHASRAGLMIADLEVLDHVADLIGRGKLAHVSHENRWIHGDLFTGYHLTGVALLPPNVPPAILFCQNTLRTAPMMEVPAPRSPAPRKVYVPFSDPAARRRAVATAGLSAVERVERKYARTATPQKIDHGSN